MHNEIIKAAEKIVAEKGLVNLSQIDVCRAVGIPVGSFTHHMKYSFKDLVDELRGRGAPQHTKRSRVTKLRTDPKLRKAHILNSALIVATRVGCHGVTRGEVAKVAGISGSLVSKYFGTMPKFKRTIMRTAIARQIPEVVAYGLANNDPYARKAPDNLKVRAINILKK